MKLLDYSHKSKDRVFYNSWVALHNIERFFMAYGDMLVKNGDWKEASDIYKLARHSQQYENWDFKEFREHRIANVKTNVALFRKPILRNERPGINETILVQTGISCRSCHQMSKTDITGSFSEYDKRKLLDMKFYLLK